MTKKENKNKKDIYIYIYIYIYRERERERERNGEKIVRDRCIKIYREVDAVVAF